MSEDEGGPTGPQTLFLSVVAFLLIKGLIDAKDARDRKRVKSVWQRLKRSERGQQIPTFWGPVRDDPFA